MEAKANARKLKRPEPRKNKEGGSLSNRGTQERPDHYKQDGKKIRNETEEMQTNKRTSTSRWGRSGSIRRSFSGTKRCKRSIARRLPLHHGTRGTLKRSELGSVSACNTSEGTRWEKHERTTGPVSKGRPRSKTGLGGSHIPIRGNKDVWRSRVARSGKATSSGERFISSGGESVEKRKVPHPRRLVGRRSFEKKKKGYRPKQPAI